MTLVLSLLGWQHLRAWYSVTTRVKERSSLLYGLRKREVDYRRKNGAFAGSLEDLRVTKIPDLPGDIHVVAGRFAGDPGFLVEYCDSFSCVAIDQEGTMRQSMTYVPDHLPEKLPVLEEGPGRFFVSPAPEEGKIQ